MSHDPGKRKEETQKVNDPQQEDPSAGAAEEIEGPNESPFFGVEPPESTGVPLVEDKSLDVPPMSTVSGAEGFIDARPWAGLAELGLSSTQGRDNIPAQAVGADTPENLLFTIDSDASNPDATLDPGNFDLVYRPGSSPGAIEQLPVRKHSHDAPIRLLGAIDDPSGDDNASSPVSDMDARSRGLLSPTSDGGPPLARPIVLVSLEDAQVRKIIDQSLAATSERDAKTCKECAQQAVDYARWRDFCELRALTGNY